MAAKTLINEALALTEKKMDMTLDDIIKMSKNNAAKPPRKQRNSNRSQKFASNFALDKSSRIRRVMDTKSALHQRSNFQANLFSWATQAVRKAAVAPIRNGPVNKPMIVNKLRPTSTQRAVSGSGFHEKQRQEQMKEVPKERLQTLDSRFANMKMQRTGVSTKKKNVARRNASRQRKGYHHGNELNLVINK